MEEGELQGCCDMVDTGQNLCQRVLLHRACNVPDGHCIGEGQTKWTYGNLIFLLGQKVSQEEVFGVGVKCVNPGQRPAEDIIFPDGE